MINLQEVDREWTLFLDRDGVINVDKIGSYIFNRQEFIFYDGVKEALKIFANIFGVIVVVTNQKGVGKGLMTLDDLHDVHHYMVSEINASGGRIDKIYFATDLDNKSFNRKPQTGMALQAKADFPQIDFSKSIIAGNRITDMQFGRNAGMHTIFILSTEPGMHLPDLLIDAAFDDLLSFTKAFKH